MKHVFFRILCLWWEIVVEIQPLKKCWLPLRQPSPQAPQKKRKPFFLPGSLAATTSWGGVDFFAHGEAEGAERPDCIHENQKRRYYSCPGPRSIRGIRGGAVSSTGVQPICPFQETMSLLKLAPFLQGQAKGEPAGSPSSRQT